MKKNFTMRDFEEGLMLAGKIPPANESDRRKLRMLKKYEDQKPKKFVCKIKKMMDKYDLRKADVVYTPEIVNGQKHVILNWWGNYRNYPWESIEPKFYILFNPNPRESSSGMVNQMPPKFKEESAILKKEILSGIGETMAILASSNEELTKNKEEVLRLAELQAKIYNSDIAEGFVKKQE